MVRLGPAHDEVLQAIRIVSEVRAEAEARLTALVVEAIDAGISANIVAKAAGIGRATVFRWVKEGDGS